jgi:hypothetical protein
MYKVLKKPKTLLAVCIVLAAALGAKADTINFTSGTAGTSNYQDVSGSIIAGNGTVTITLNNDLTDSQVFSIIQNISGIYFNVSGYGGNASLQPSSALTTTITNDFAALGAMSPTGWTVVNNIAGGLAVCVICPGGNPVAGPAMTIVGGDGSGTYANANGSINTGSHHPFLVGPGTFTVNVAGVTSSSTFSNVVIQFGTTAKPPTTVPYSGSLSLLLMTSVAVSGVLARRYR